MHRKTHHRRVAWAVQRLERWMSSDHMPYLARVLVVENDDRVRRLIVATLRQRGCDVVEAEYGIDLLGWMGSALWSPTENEFDVIVSDVDLPDLTALEVMAALRTYDTAVPVILVTASRDLRLNELAYELGASVVLRKPFDVNDLAALVTSLRVRRPVGRSVRMSEGIMHAG
jgi:CheY-like chemotaxis protein